MAGKTLVPDRSGYAAAVVRVLREHTSWLADEIAAEVVMAAITRNQADPQPVFSVIVDDPASANWRLKADRADRRRVRLTCYRLSPRPADDELLRAINDALRKLEG